MIYSGDDFSLMMPSQMVSMETTLGIYNQSSWDDIKPNDTIFTGYRSMVANRLADCGSAWTENFMEYNSGTYFLRSVINSAH